MFQWMALYQHTYWQHEMDSVGSQMSTWSWKGNLVKVYWSGKLKGSYWEWILSKYTNNIYAQNSQLKREKQKHYTKNINKFYCWRHHVHQKQGLEAFELELIWLLPPWRLAFVVPECTMQVFKGVKEFYPAMMPMNYIRPLWHNHPTCVVVAISYHSFLVELKNYLTRVILCLGD